MTDNSGVELITSRMPSLTARLESIYSMVINDVQSSLKPNSQHSSWVLDQEYQSSFTLPISNGSQLLGFVF